MEYLETTQFNFFSAKLLSEINCPKCQSYDVIKKGKGKKGNQRYFCKDCGRNFAEILNINKIHAKHYLPENISPEEMFEYDVWDARIIGLKPIPSTGGYTLNFLRIKPLWLRKAIKKWIQYRSSNEETSSLKAKIESISSFSKFIENKNIIPSDINRKLVEDYLVFGIDKNKSGNSKYHLIGDLKSFFEDCARFSFANITKKVLIYKEDFPKTERALPRFIPDDVLKQIDDNLIYLAQPVVCMIQMLRGTGIRISELVKTKLDCLQQDSEGMYWIRVYQIKMKKEINLCISRDLANLIIQQQEYIKTHFHSNFHYLFCSTKNASWFQSYGSNSQKDHKRKNINFFEPIPKKLHAGTLRGYMKQFAEEKQIKNTTGEIFPLSKLHRFRHTHGTELINNQVPQHIVQKRLGHASPEMTSVYAHIHDKTMKQEMEKFWDGRVFNNQGQVIVSENPELDTAGMQWIKRNMKAQTLPDGFCGLPVTQSCPVQGSPCLTCSHLRTTIEFLDVHKKRLEETEKLIENARANGWDRQVENNLPIAENLRKIIRGLEQKEIIHGDEKFPK